MIKINGGNIEMDGSAKQILSEFACGLTMICDEIGRGPAMSQLLASYYSMLAEERGYGFKQAIEMYKEDTKDALDYIQFYLDLPGDNLKEKLKNTGEEEEL